MRLLLIFAVSLVAATARAATPPAPEVIAEVDLLRVQLAQTYAESAQLTADKVKREADEAVKSFRAKYHLGDGDSIDPQTRAIRRAPKPAPAAAQEPKKK